MKLPALLAIAVLFSSTAPARPVAPQDFQELIAAAVSAGALTAPDGTGTICVQRELESPLKLSKETMELFHMRAGMPGVMPQAATDQAAIEKAFAVAVSPAASVASQTAIARVSYPYLLYSSAGPTRPKCEVPPIPGPGSRVRNHVTRLVLSRPVFANGFAFIDESSVCMGLCGSGWLRVFKKKNGKWTQVHYRNLFVS